ncbi:hypothetical protein [Shewanella canadensis]|uniref:hypothetical protein n=1 Tax=Shewanella canadensis TaxID=271096 RepID=UPI00163B338C|nr:hypothetical protein [Shewanella canadensis]
MARIIYPSQLKMPAWGPSTPPDKSNYDKGALAAIKHEVLIFYEYRYTGQT